MEMVSPGRSACRHHWASVNWDMLLYLPSQRYPQDGYGGRLERVGDWAVRA